MRYESLPKKFFRWIGDAYKYIKDEFGNWAYVIIAVFFALIYKPVVKLFDMAAGALWYVILGAAGLWILYWLFNKLFGRR